jgi:type II secretory pathway component PulF
MKPAVRTALQFLPIVLQGAGVAAALGIISFIVPVTTRLIKEAEGKTPIPTPSRLLVEHAGAAKLAILVLFAISVVTFLVTRSKMKEESDRLIVQGAVFSLVWYVGITLLGGVVMAALLPHFALGAVSR